jgi:hypothetical protein
MPAVVALGTFLVASFIATERGNKVKVVWSRQP